MRKSTTKKSTTKKSIPKKFNPVVPPQIVLEPKFWDSLLKKGQATVSWGKDWKLDIVAKPSRKIPGRREREALTGVIFKKRF